MTIIAWCSIKDTHAQYQLSLIYNVMNSFAPHNYHYPIQVVEKSEELCTIQGFTLTFLPLTTYKNTSAYYSNLKSSTVPVVIIYK